MAGKTESQDWRLPITSEFRTLVRERIGDRAWKPIAEAAGMSEMALIRIAGDPKDQKRSSSSDRLVGLCRVLEIPLFEVFPLDAAQRKVLRAIELLHGHQADALAFADEVMVMAEWKAHGPASRTAAPARAADSDRRPHRHEVIDVSPIIVTPRKRP